MHTNVPQPRILRLLILAKINKFCPLYAKLMDDHNFEVVKNM
ncbi:9779_t:CDS:2 [Gigaspora rosea]|nr:9779_t:CDS:2 [Gigaspora rosea]